MDGQRPRHGKEASYIAADAGDASERASGRREYGYVIWLGLAVSYFLFRQASESRAYANGQVHPEFCLARNCLASLTEECR